MSEHATERPEGPRESPLAVHGFRFALELVALVAVYAVFAYVFDQAPRAFTRGALHIALGFIAALVLGWTTEAWLMRKHWSLVSGSALIGLWLSYLAIAAQAHRWTFLIGFAGVVLMTAAPSFEKHRADDLQSGYLAGHPRYAVRRPLLVRAALYGAGAFAALGFASGLYRLLFG